MNISDNLRQSLGMYDWVRAKSLMINPTSVVCLKKCVFFVDYIYPFISA